MRPRKALELEPIPFLFGEENDILPGPWQPDEELDGTIGMLISCLCVDGCKTISLAFEDFLREKASCASCRKPAGQILDNGGCDCCPDQNGSGYELLLFGAADYDRYYQLAQASDKGARTKRRNQVLGRIPKPFYQVLGTVQNFACYYCTCELMLEAANTDARAHIEHQNAFEGSYLENLVLSCRRCNTQKGMDGADQFSKFKERELTADQIALRSEIWKSVRSWRKSSDGKAWAEKLPGRPKE